MARWQGVITLPADAVLPVFSCGFGGIPIVHVLRLEWSTLAENLRKDDPSWIPSFR